MGKALSDDPNKLGAGNAGGAVRGSGQLSRRVFLVAGGRISAEVFGLVSGSMAVGLVFEHGRGAVRGNGGFLRFRAGLDGRVRMTESEWNGQGAGFAWFSGAAVKPCRLHRRDLGRAIGAGGVGPLRRAQSVPCPVVSGRCQFGEKCPDRASPATIGLCSAMDRAGNGRKILPALLGSGVRAARCAGVNDRSARRPEFRRIVVRSGGLGEELPGPCAKGVNEPRTLGPGVRSVN